MSLKTICDRKGCGAIIELHTGGAKLELQAPGVEKYDLCPKCLEEFRRWMENPTVRADIESAPTMDKDGNPSVGKADSSLYTREPLKERMI